MHITPTVAIVGRPNVGKSTLFNRLVGRRQAIVHDQPGITRDRITGSARVGEDGSCQLIDTGGLVPGDDPLGLNEQVLLAVEESDLLLFVVDGTAGPGTADEQVWTTLRRRGKPALLVVNKADTRTAREQADLFYTFGLDLYLVSAEHGTGIEELRQAVGAQLPDTAVEVPVSDAPAIAIVGRPNVGKSSILNRIVGSERSLVSPMAGTTRDPVDTPIEFEGKPYLLVDTAGIRRRGKVSGHPEELAVMMARRQIQRADLAVLVIDAAQGVTTNDLSIAGSIWDLGRAAVVAVNKWDLLDEATRKKLDESWPRLDELLAVPERINSSATSGRGLQKLFPAVERTLERYHTRVTTGELNRIFERAVARQPPPTHKGQSWRLYYCTQVGEAPPTFMLFANRVLKQSDPYRRYLINRLREALDLPGVPLRLVTRRR